jgi:predicted membrane metal-binding protein
MSMQNANREEIAKGVSAGIMSAVTSLAGLYGLYLLYTTYPLLSFGIIAVLIAALVLWGLGAWVVRHARYWRPGVGTASVIIGVLFVGVMNYFYDASAPSRQVSHAATPAKTAAVDSKVDAIVDSILRGIAVTERR